VISLLFINKEIFLTCT